MWHGSTNAGLIHLVPTITDRNTDARRHHHWRALISLSRRQEQEDYIYLAPLVVVLASEALTQPTR